MGIDTKQFETLFKQNFVAITVYCNRYVRDTDQAKDIAHQAFMKVWERREQFPENSNISALLYRIAHNLSINYLRDNKKFCTDEEMPLTQTDNTEADYDIRTAELEANLIDTINKMPEKSRQVFIMSRYDKLSNKKIAETLGVSVKTVEAHITTALKILKKKFFGK